MSLDAQEKLKNDAEQIDKDEAIYRHSRYKPLIDVMRKQNRRMADVDKNADLDLQSNCKQESKIRLDHLYFLRGKSANRAICPGSDEIYLNYGQAMGRILETLKSKRKQKHQKMEGTTRME